MTEVAVFRIPSRFSVEYRIYGGTEWWHQESCDDARSAFDAVKRFKRGSKHEWRVVRVDKRVVQSEEDA